MKFYPRPSPPTDQKKYFMIPIPQIAPETTRRISLMANSLSFYPIYVTHYWFRDASGLILSNQGFLQELINHLYLSG